MKLLFFFVNRGSLGTYYFVQKFLTIKNKRKCLFRLILFHMSHDNKKRNKQQLKLELKIFRS